MAGPPLGPGLGWFTGWVYTWVDEKIRQACKKSMFTKLLVHAFGILIVITSIYLMIEFTLTRPLFLVAGLFLSFIGVTLFAMPLGLDEE